MRRLARLLIAANKKGWTIRVEDKHFTLYFAPRPDAKMTYTYKELKQLLTKGE